MIQQWYDWIAARVAAHNGVLTWDEVTPDLGKTPWLLAPMAEQTQYHEHGSTTYRQEWELVTLWGMGTMSPQQIQTMMATVRALALEIESGLGRPAAVEAIEIGRISYQPDQAAGLVAVSIPIAIIATQEG